MDANPSDIVEELSDMDTPAAPDVPVDRDAIVEELDRLAERKKALAKQKAEADAEFKAKMDELLSVVEPGQQFRVGPNIRMVHDQTRKNTSWKSVVDAVKALADDQHRQMLEQAAVNNTTTGHIYTLKVVTD